MFRSGTGPTFRSSKNDHGEPRFVNGFASASSLLNLANLSVSPVHRCSHIFVNFAIGRVSSSGRNLSITFVFDETNLVSVTRVEEREFGVVHRLLWASSVISIGRETKISKTRLTPGIVRSEILNPLT